MAAPSSSAPSPSETKPSINMDMLTNLLGEETVPRIVNIVNSLGGALSNLKTSFEDSKEWVKTEAATSMYLDFLKDPNIYLSTVDEKIKMTSTFTRYLAASYECRERILALSKDEMQREEKVGELRDELKVKLYWLMREVTPLEKIPVQFKSDINPLYNSTDVCKMQ